MWWHRTKCATGKVLSVLLFSCLVWSPALKVWAIALDQSTAEEFCDNCATTTKDISFGTLPAVGSFVGGCIAGVDFSGDNVDFITSVADNQGNGAYTLIKRAPATNGQATAAIFYKENVASAGTFTITFTASNNTLLTYSWRALSFTGIATASALDVSQVGAVDGTSTSLSVTTAATTFADELVLACGSIKDSVGDANNNLALATGYTSVISQTNTLVRPGASAGYKIIAATGTQNATWTYDALGGSGSNAGVVATFHVPLGCRGALLLMGAGPC